MTEQILFPLSQLLVSFINHTRLWKNWEREKSPSAHVAKRKSHGSESLGSRNASIELLPRAKLSSAATLFSTTIQNRVFSSCSLIHKKEHFTLKDFLTLQAGANYDEVFCLPPLKKKKKSYIPVDGQTSLIRRQEELNQFSNHCDPWLLSPSLLLQKMLGKHSPASTQ